MPRDRASLPTHAAPPILAFVALMSACRPGAPVALPLKAHCRLLRGRPDGSKEPLASRVTSSWASMRHGLLMV